MVFKSRKKHQTFTPFGRHFRTVGQLFGVLFLSVFLEPFLRAFFEILVPKGLPNGGLWEVIWGSVKGFSENVEIVSSLVRELHFQGLRGGQFGRFVGVVLRGVSQQASGGVFFEIFIDFRTLGGGPLGPLQGHWRPQNEVSILGHFNVEKAATTTLGKSSGVPKNNQESL